MVLALSLHNGSKADVRLLSGRASAMPHPSPASRRSVVGQKPTMRPPDNRYTQASSRQGDFSASARRIPVDFGCVWSIGHRVSRGA